MAIKSEEVQVLWHKQGMATAWISAWPLVHWQYESVRPQVVLPIAWAKHSVAQAGRLSWAAAMALKAARRMVVYCIVAGGMWLKECGVVSLISNEGGGGEESQ